MGQIVAWNDIKFSLGGTSINAVEDIEITGSCETEDSETDEEKYVKRKSSKPYEIGMTAILDARLGVNVQSMAKKMTEAARKSTTGYFYSGSSKLFSCKFMMVEASIGEISMNPAGKWLYCEVKLKLKQSTKYNGSTKSSSSGGGSSGGSSSGGGSSSSKKSSTKSTSTTKSATVSVAISQLKSSSGVQAAVNASPTASSIISAVNQFNSIVKSSSAFQSSSSSSSSKVVLPVIKK